MKRTPYVSRSAELMVIERASGDSSKWEEDISLSKERDRHILRLYSLRTASYTAASLWECRIIPRVPPDILLDNLFVLSQMVERASGSHYKSDCHIA